MDQFQSNCKENEKKKITRFALDLLNTQIFISYEQD